MARITVSRAPGLGTIVPMHRTWLLIAAPIVALAAGACGSDDHHLPDARPVDAAHSVDAAGSGSNAVASAMETSPRDHGLELMVVVTSLVVVVGPVRRRRRRDDDDTAPRT